MRKRLNVKLSWLSEDNWKNLIEAGYLPVLAINCPTRFRGTAIHFPELAPNPSKSENPEMDYLKELYTNVDRSKIVKKFNILSHLARSRGRIVVLTEEENDPYRKILGKFLEGGLDNGATEYEWTRENSGNLADL